MRLSLPIIFLAALLATAQAEPSAIFLVRHAERADAGGPAQKDPDLSQTGRAQARAIAEMLRDAKITAIYTTEFHRTQETAKPLAAKLGIEPQVIPAKETQQLVAALRRQNGNVLVVGHSNTLPEIMQALGLAEPPSLGERAYDNLFLVLRDPVPRLIQLHFAAGKE